MNLDSVMNVLMPIVVIAFVFFIFYKPFHEQINSFFRWLKEQFGKGKEKAGEAKDEFGEIAYVPRDGFNR
jgi:hypothetical protein